MTNAGVSGLSPRIYPPREIYTVAACGRQPIRDMKRWVQGQPFHPYGRRSWDCLDGETVAEAVERCRDIPARLEFTGELLSYRSTVEFWITYQQTGDPGGSGFSGPWSSIEDACYASLTMIEEHEREVYEQTLIVGLA